MNAPGSALDETAGSARAVDLLALAIVGIAFAHVPDLPRGMIAADVVFALGVPLVSWRARARSCVPTRELWAWTAAFIAAASASAFINGGSYVKLLGHAELCGIAVATAAAARIAPRTVERALVGAAAIAAGSAALGAALWVFGIETSLLNPTTGDLVGDGYPRVRGVTERANQLASLVATGSLFLAADPALVAARWLRRAIWLVIAIAMVLSFSRTAPVWALALWWLHATRSRAPTASRMGFTAAAVLAGLAVLWLSVRYAVVLSPTDPLEARIAWDQPGTRWINITGAWETARSAPIVGIGPGGTPSGVWTAHLTWLNLWAVLGVGGLLTFAGLFGRAVWRARRVAPLCLALAVFAIDSLHRDIEDLRHLWVLFGLAFAAGSPKAAAGSRPPSTPTPLCGRRPGVRA